MKELNPKEYLSKYKGQEVDFYRFPGNYGDSLIWHGTKKMLDYLNIKEKSVDISSPKHNDILLIDGGGNFVDYYSDIRNFLIRKSDLYKEIIILPHTIFGDAQIAVLNNLSSQTTIFCRENISAKFLNARYAKGEVYLWHDCAFYNKFPERIDGKGILNVFRSDKESIVDKRPEDNDDLSYKGYATKPLDDLINVLKKSAEINTDRLHIAICGVLLGKQVRLYPNSYYKNKAVFEYSLSKFHNISFVDKI